MWFHIAGARSFADILLKNKRFKNRGTNTFVLRQLSSRLNTNSVMIGVLAFLFAFSVIFLNVVIVEKVSTDEALYRDCPFDVIGVVPADNIENAISPSEGESIISKYSKVEDSAIL